jgi:hypothetical protein
MLASITAAIAAVATLAVGLLGAWMWFVKRRHEANPQQRSDDRRAELDKVLAELAAARSVNDDARAESLLRRVRELSDPR